MKQRIAAFLMLLLAVVGMVPFAMADDDNASGNSTDNSTTPVPTLTSVRSQEREDNNQDDDNETERDEREDTARETLIMDSGPGAQYRLLQLSRELERQALHMQVAASTLDPNSTTNLSAIAAETRVLADKVNAAINGTNLTVDAAKQLFVESKQDGVALVKHFREEAKALWEKGDRQKIQDAWKEIDKAELNKFKDMMEAKRNEVNAKRIHDQLDKLGISNDALVEGVKDGSIKESDARKELNDQIKNLTTERRQKVFDKLQEEAAKQRVQHVAALEKQKEAFEKQAVRAEERAKMLENKGEREFAKTAREATRETEKLREEATKLREKAMNDQAKIREAKENSGLQLGRNREDGSGNGSEGRRMMPAAPGREPSRDDGRDADSTEATR